MAYLYIWKDLESRNTQVHLIAQTNNKYNSTQNDLRNVVSKILKLRVVQNSIRGKFRQEILLIWGKKSCLNWSSDLATNSQLIPFPSRVTHHTGVIYTYFFISNSARAQNSKLLSWNASLSTQNCLAICLTFFSCFLEID